MTSGFVRLSNIVALLILAPALRAAPADVPVVLTIPKVPSSTAEFLELRKSLATTPEGGAAVFVAAMMAHARDASLGEQLFTIALHRSQLVRGKPGAYKGFRPARSFEYFTRRLPSRGHLPFAYVRGTKVEDTYRARPPFQIEFTRNRYSTQRNGDIKVFVTTAGGVRPRPIRLRKNNRGIWKVVEASSMFVGVPLPKTGTDDDL